MSISLCQMSGLGSELLDSTLSRRDPVVQTSLLVETWDLNGNISPTLRFDESWC